MRKIILNSKKLAISLHPIGSQDTPYAGTELDKPGR